MSASFERDSLHLVIVVMASKTEEDMWLDVPILTLWAIERLNILCN